MSRLELRRKELKQRKNFLPALAIALFLWIALISVIYLVSPNSFGAIYVFFLLLFATVFFTTSLLFGHSRRGLLVSVAITIFMVLRYLGIGNLLNALLLVGVLVTFELFFSKNS
jgi:hypothetical protein